MTDWQKIPDDLEQGTYLMWGKWAMSKGETWARVHYNNNVCESSTGVRFYPRLYAPVEPPKPEPIPAFEVGMEICVNKADATGDYVAIWKRNTDTMEWTDDIWVEFEHWPELRKRIDAIVNGEG